MNIIALCVFPFVAKPIIQSVTKMDNDSWEQMMDDRSTVVKQFIRSAMEIK
jgi:hypothetical protein